MPNPTEHKTAQTRSLEYAEAILLRHSYEGRVGWTFVSREEAEKRRGLNHKERKEHKEFLVFLSLRSLRLHYFLN